MMSSSPTTSTSTPTAADGSAPAAAAAAAAAVAVDRERRRWPAEWEAHAATLVLWPHNPGTFPLALAQREVLQFVRLMAFHGEPVLLFARDAAQAAAVRAELSPEQPPQQQQQQSATSTVREEEEEHESATTAAAAAPIHVLVCPSNDTWARDTAPTFVVGSSSSPPSSSSSNDDDQEEPEDSNSNRIDDNSNTATTTTTTRLIALDWDFNAYGGPGEGCYWPCDLDRRVAGTVCRALVRDAATRQLLGLSDANSNANNHNNLQLQHHPVSLVLEGGAIHTDGAGTLLTTAECLLHPNRNPGRSRAEIERIVLEATGCTHMIWLEHGLAFDGDTNGHVDNWACFIAPGVVVLAWTDDCVDDAVNYRRCRAALRQLQTARDARGRALAVRKLPLPPPLHYTRDEIAALQCGGPAPQQETGDTIVVPRQAGDRLAASYVNFYRCGNNGAVLVPQFGGAAAKADARALQTLREIFASLPNSNDGYGDTPPPEIVGVPSREILIGGGNLHCLTQQIPRAAAAITATTAAVLNKNNATNAEAASNVTAAAAATTTIAEDSV